MEFSWVRYDGVPVIATLQFPRDFQAACELFCGLYMHDPRAFFNMKVIVR